MLKPMDGSKSGEVSTSTVRTLKRFRNANVEGFGGEDSWAFFRITAINSCLQRKDRASDAARNAVRISKSPGGHAKANAKDRLNQLPMSPDVFHSPGDRIKRAVAP